MLRQIDLPYFRNREQMEREAAQCASHPAAREKHLKLAEHYADRVWALSIQRRNINTRKPAGV